MITNSECVGLLAHSPIEISFGKKMVELWESKIDGPILIATGRDYPPNHDIPEGLSIFTQKPMGRYRLDFLLCLHMRPKKSFIAIECDGHEFHERTKEQAKKDRRRDRELQMCGLRVLRFTGSEIHEDAECCAQEVLEQLIHGLAESRIISW